MYKNNIISLTLFLMIVSMLVSCKINSVVEPETPGGGNGTGNTATPTNTGGNSSISVATALAANCANHEEAVDYTWSSSGVIPITFDGSAITGSGTGVTINGNTVVITAGGTYSFSGTLTDGQILVNSADANTVKLILNGVDISNSKNAPVFIEKSEKTVIILADNTQNSVTDPTSYIFADAATDEPNAAIFSKSNLSIYGSGSLTVKGNYNDGISSKDGLIIKSGTINVTAKDDGIRGKDYLIIRNGNITVSSAGDGLKSDKDADVTMGYIYIENGIINVTAANGDAITAETDVLIKTGEFTIKSGGGSGYTANSTISTKGIKGIAKNIIDGGVFNINSSDDALHSNKNMSINGGNFTISTGDDGMHADSTLGIYGGTINITKSYEGIESAYLTINDGTIHVVSSDDGLNGAGGNDGSSPGQFVTTGSYFLYIGGGYIYVNATGDGIDINGSITMAGGTVIVNGPTSDGNGALDYDGAFKLTGGYMLAVGSSGMAQTAGTTSTQYAVLLNLQTYFNANTIFHIKASDGTEIVTFTPVKRIRSIAFSSSKLKLGTTYDIYTGGSSSGTAADGLYQNGVYTAGTKYGSFTISGIVTRVNNL